jgi:hypothetical protein
MDERLVRAAAVGIEVGSIAVRGNST